MTVISISCIRQDHVAQKGALWHAEERGRAAQALYPSVTRAS